MNWGLFQDAVSHLVTSVQTMGLSDTGTTMEFTIQTVFCTCNNIFVALDHRLQV